MNSQYTQARDEWLSFWEGYQGPGAEVDSRAIRRSFLAHLRRRNAPSTVRRKTIQLRTLCEEEGMSVWRDADTPKAPSLLPRVLDPAAIQKLIDQTEGQAQQVILACACGSPASKVASDLGLNRRQVHRLVKREGRRVLGKDVNPRMLRASYIVLLLNRGHNLIEVAAVAGHESPVSTARYVGLAIERLRRDVEKAHPFGLEKAAE